MSVAMQAPRGQSGGLTLGEVSRFEECGYHFPQRVLEPEQFTTWRQKFLEYREQCQAKLATMPISQHYQLFSETHFVAGWVHELVSQPRILDAVQSLLGENLLVWNTNWFAKMPGEKTFVSWHQDGMYWNLSPFKVVTAWVALSPSIGSNGSLRVIPGTHCQPAIPHTETFDKDNALSRGQDIAKAVDESQAVDIELQPGEMSLHHLWIAHGSRANTSPDTPRIGLAIRYVSPEVKQDSPSKPLALLVRGRDDYGHFELLPPPPATNELRPDDPSHLAIVNRIRASIMQERST